MDCLTNIINTETFYVIYLVVVVVLLVSLELSYKKENLHDEATDITRTLLATIWPLTLVILFVFFITSILMKKGNKNEI